ncbi:hypothetical protein PV327_006182 [Microctonus hyperodae]|uniref:Uncharacterized protein n=1 Tax=Microctonus hyperodae TaxID=165561 RepID=A0AA39KI24_MICHY|nr:hypothetical protein PV327_006182 [Microctonus hyperodae]
MRFTIITIFVILYGQNSQSENINRVSFVTNGGNINIGQSCKRDYECIENAYCRSQKTCWCDETYTPDPNMTVCHATAGTNCNNQNDCKTMSNAECIQGFCICMNNFILDIKNSSNCMICPKKSGDKCQQNDECIEALTNAHCVNEKCKCNNDYKFINITGKCIRGRGIYQSCKYDYECLDDVKPNDLHCPNGECIYRAQENGSRLNIPNYLLIFGSSYLFFVIYVWQD